MIHADPAPRSSPGGAPAAAAAACELAGAEGAKPPPLWPPGGAAASGSRSGREGPSERDDPAAEAMAPSRAGAAATAVTEPAAVATGGASLQMRLARMGEQASAAAAACAGGRGSRVRVLHPDTWTYSNLREHPTPLDQAVTLFSLLLQLALLFRSGARLSLLQLGHQGVLLALRGVCLAAATYLPEDAWRRWRVVLIAALRLAIASVPSQRSAEASMGCSRCAPGRRVRLAAGRRAHPPICRPHRSHPLGLAGGRRGAAAARRHARRTRCCCRLVPLRHG